MPIKRSSSKAALKSNIKTNMKEVKAGTSVHSKSSKQALALEYRVAALEGTVVMLQAQLVLLAQQQYRPPSNGLDPRWPQIGPNVSG
jgi:hypothetical protein